MYDAAPLQTGHTTGSTVHSVMLPYCVAVDVLLLHADHTRTHEDFWPLQCLASSHTVAKSQLLWTVLDNSKQCMVLVSSTPLSQVSFEE